MRATIGTLTLLAALALAGCGGEDGPDLAACEDAMREQFATALSQGESAPEGERPGECDGVSDEDLQEMAGRIVGEQFEDSDVPTPSS